MGDRQHWDRVYDARDETALTWFEAAPTLSHDLVRRHVRPGDAILDVGGGASRLVDALLEDGLGPITVLDLSPGALAASRARLGPRAGSVTWIAADITGWTPPRRYALWHDRAVFHFLTAPSDRAAYVATMAAALTPGGTAIIATFAPDGPETCSGLPVCRYSPETLAAEIDTHAPGRFVPLGAARHLHRTPEGATQAFQVSWFRRTDASA
ncbi:class I SAM-dependent methyltransferase [Rhodovulum sp. YNF3179]|uniref:class I SAM-dependent methyltransferase n=1 Tax=Rhodovulum sp. YNF3179 TaxID=3425127 RepID=UPI003D328945